MIFLSFFAFGILGSFLVNYYAPPFCQAVYSDDLQNKILAFQGTLYLGAEASAFVLRLFKKTEPSNHTSHSNYRVNHLISEPELLRLYYEGMFTRFIDFLNKNPQFADLFKEKLKNAGQQAILEKLS